MSHTAAVFIQLGGLLLVLSLLSRFASAFRQSAIPFYMTLGLFLGIGGVIPLTESQEFLEIGSEIGVVLLLLMIGLEYSPKELLVSVIGNRRIGVLDAALNAVPGAIAGWLMGWGLVGSLILAGVTWVSSSGVIVRMLSDLGRMANRETPTVISVLVLEDLAMAFYLPILSAVAVGATIMEGAVSVGIAIGVVVVIISGTYFYGRRFAKLFSADNAEALVVGVSGMAILVAGIATQVNVSAAVGAFLVGIGLSGRVAASAEKALTPLRDFFAAIFFVYFGIQTNPADIPDVLLAALALAVITMFTKFSTGYIAARRVGIAVPGRWRAGLALTPRGEFSIIIASIAVGAGLNPEIMPFAATYMMVTIIMGPVLARIPDMNWFKQRVRARS